MLLSIAQLATDSLDEYGTILLADGILTLLGSLVGIHIQQLLGMNKVNLFGQERLNLWIMLTGEILSAQNGSIDATNHIAKESQRAVFLLDHCLPVPLVYI